METDPESTNRRGTVIVIVTVHVEWLLYVSSHLILLKSLWINTLITFLLQVMKLGYRKVSDLAKVTQLLCAKGSKWQAGVEAQGCAGTEERRLRIEGLMKTCLAGWI